MKVLIPSQLLNCKNFTKNFESVKSFYSEELLIYYRLKISQK